MASPERRIFNPADQSFDKSPRSFTRKHNIAVWMSESLQLPKNSRGTVASFLANVFSFPADVQPEAKTNGPTLYESMRHGFGKELNSAPTGTCVPSQDSAAIYENCLKCRGERCHPPPPVTPADMYHNRNILTKSQEHKANEELHHEARSDGSQSVDWNDEGLNGKEGKRPLQSFCHSFGVLFPLLCFELDLLCFCSSHFIINKNPLFSASFLSDQLLVFSELCDVPFCCAESCEE